MTHQPQDGPFAASISERLQPKALSKVLRQGWEPVQVDLGSEVPPPLVGSTLSCLEVPLQALGTASPLAARLREESAALEPQTPPEPAAEGYAPVAASRWARRFSFAADTSVRLDTRTGALASFVLNGREWAGAANPLLFVRYQTLVFSDFQAWWAQ